MFSPMNKPISNWKNQRIWIIGASSGIGAALAEQALNAGAHVVLSARNEAQLKQLAQSSTCAYVVPFDVANQADWTMAYQQTQQHLAKIDLIIFCAATYQPERSWEINAASADRTLRTNLGAVYTGLATVLPDMVAQGCGGIAVIASVAGYFGLPNASVYGPTKAALINLTEILYSDLHPKGLNVYLINPGFVKTALTDRNTFTMPALQTPQQAADAIWQGMSAGRFEIHFPRRFTQVMKLLQLLPYRWRFSLLERFLKTS